MSGVICLLKRKKEAMEWADVKLDFTKPGFLNLVLDANFENIPQKVLDFITKEFLEKDTWNIEGISKASKVAGPLASWL